MTCTDIFDLFLQKHPASISILLDDVSQKKNLCITFLNPYTIAMAEKHNLDYSDFDYICSDGIVPVLLERIWGFKTSRISFDFGSLAKPLFDYAQKNSKSIYLWGTSDENLQCAIARFRQLYPNIIIAGSHNGYNKPEENKSIIAEILQLSPDFVIIAQGMPRQDETSVLLKRSGFAGIIFTCGGFLHQTAMSQTGYYYPEWINRWNLRTFYRLMHERYILKRLLLHYIPFVFRYQIFLLKKRLQLCSEKISIK